jgi:hydroxymethylpyrimidine/phosphomethylpyrimidine kinase
MKTPPKAMTVAGSDSGGGAGIQADLKTFEALGVYGTSVLTALTAQNTLGVQSVHTVPWEFIQSQWRSVMGDIGADALKIGMLFSKENIEGVALLLQGSTVPKSVLDPVMVAKGGASLLQPNAVSALRERLLPFVSLATPNTQEAEILAGIPIKTRFDMERAAHSLLQWCPAVLVKGGHLVDSGGSPDYLATREGIGLWIEGPRVDTLHTHGTGCTLSAAITAFLAQNGTLVDSVQKAKKYLQHALVAGSKLKIGNGNGPVWHSLNAPN